MCRPLRFFPRFSQFAHFYEQFNKVNLRARILRHSGSVLFHKNFSAGNLQAAGQIEPFAHALRSTSAFVHPAMALKEMRAHKPNTFRY